MVLRISITINQFLWRRPAAFQRANPFHANVQATNISPGIGFAINQSVSDAAVMFID